MAIAYPRMHADFDQIGGMHELDEKYTFLDVQGDGMYGTVYLAKDVITDEVVAIKRLKFDDDEVKAQKDDGVPTHVIREVSLLRNFVHPNIVQLKAIQCSGPMSYSLVFEYIDRDLYKVMKGYRRNGEHLPMNQFISYSQQFLNGIHACHVRLIVHRDIKPQNVLVGLDDNLKICDFGMARIFSVPTMPYTHDVITLWYRAPELLLGAERYGPEVDIWSAGCVIAEMAVGHAVFPGDSEIGTIFKIMKLLGSPTEETWPGYQQFLHWSNAFPQWPVTNLNPILDARPELGEQGIDLIRNLLRMNPERRLGSRRAKTHPFFT